MIKQATSWRVESGVRVRPGLVAVFVVVVPCLALNGLAVLLPAHRFSESPDVVGWLVGVIVLASGAFVVGRGQRTVGALVIGAAVLWHVPDLARLLPAAASTIAQRSALVHITLLGLGVISASEWVGVRNRGLLTLAFVIAGCSGWTGGWRVAVPAAGGALLALLVSTRLGRDRRAHATRAPWLAAGALLGFELFGSGIARALDRGTAAESWLTGAHQLAVAGTAVLLAVAEARTVAVDAIDLQFDTLDELESVIAAAIGVQSAHVALAAEGGGWLDVHGRVIDPVDAPGLLVVDGAGGAVALVSGGIAKSAGVPASAQRVLRLARDHARLRATITGQIAELERSRRRILVAQDRAREEIHSAVRSGPLSALLEIERDLADRDGLDNVRSAAEGARANLERLAHDLDPVGGRSLAMALDALVQSCPADVEARIDASLTVDDAVARTAWFTVSEGLSNVVKHAPGAMAWVEVGRRGGAAGVLVTIVDNGPGGADPNGSGLRGLADRAQALGGSLNVTREPRGGTRLELRV